jgi:hypothetical protein
MTKDISKKKKILIFLFLIVVFILFYKALFHTEHEHLNYSYNQQNSADLSNAENIHKSQFHADLASPIGSRQALQKLIGTPDRSIDIPRKAHSGNIEIADWLFSEEKAFGTGIIISILIGIALPLSPIYVYLRAGWIVKSEDILDGLNSEAREAYLKLFSNSLEVNTPSSLQETSKLFGDLYKKWYGRQYYIIPLLILVPVLVFLCSEVAITAAYRLPWGKNNSHSGLAYFVIPPIPVAATAGAYLWVTSDFIRRARRLDFSPSDIAWAILRLVIAVPMGYAFSGLAATGVGSALAFGLGAFPLSAIQDMLRQYVYKALMQTPAAILPSDAVIKLQGIDEEISIRLANEGITTVPQIAYCDPIRVTMRSSLNFNYITDLMNQALAWIYLEDKLTVMRLFGLRGAAEIADLYNDLISTDVNIKGNADKKLIAIVAALDGKLTVELLYNAFMQIAGDPYTVFVRLAWINPFKYQRSLRESDII